MLRLAFNQNDMVFRGQRLARPICGNDTADSSARDQNGLPTMVLPPIALLAALGRAGRIVADEQGFHDRRPLCCCRDNAAFHR